MKRQDFKDVMRGDPKELVIYIPRDYSAHKLSFGVKAGSLSNMLNLATADILIQKLNTAAGGNDNQLTASYANGKTKITVKLAKDDTQDFAEEIYSYDLTAQPADASTEPLTIAYGELAMIGDVQTDFDGLPEDSIHGFIKVDLTGVENGSFLIVENEDVVNYPLSEVKSILEIEEMFSTEEKEKLAGIAENANYYEHPTNHSASIIEETSERKFVTEEEKLAIPTRVFENAAVDFLNFLLTGEINFTTSPLDLNIPQLPFNITFETRIGV